VASNLLKQLASSLDVLDPTFNSLYKHQANNTRPSLSELVGLFTKCSRQFEKVSVVLDAFDECVQEQQQRILESIVKQFSEAGISIFITTRVHCLDHLKVALDRAAVENITANRDDIENFLARQLQERNKRTSEGFKAELITTISARAEGM
jgi:hypothetical protein